MTLEDSNTFVSQRLASVWDSAEKWTDTELARWLMFCIGNGLSLRVRRKDDTMTIEIDEERWPTLARTSFIHLSQTHMVNIINRNPQHFDRVKNLLPLKMYRENSSSQYHALTF